MTVTEAGVAPIGPVVSVLPIWKNHSALGWFCASRMSAPVSWADVEKQ